MSTALREFQVMAKPIGAICNLDCSYCYYLKKEFLYPKDDAFRMSDETLERYVVQQIEAAPGPMVNFAWHGGEPTALGLDYFQKIVALQKKHRPEGKKITNGIQTNGTLLDDAWCRFFAAERFSVGLSIDGPRELHDGYRVDKGQKPTHKQVLRAFRLLGEHRVHVDVLCVGPGYRVGNIAEPHLGDLVESPGQRAFGEAKRDSLPRYCRECEVRDMCNGGCPKDRFIPTPDGEAGLNYLCAGYKKFFIHSRPYLKRMVDIWNAGEPIEKLMEAVRAEDARGTAPQVGRNDPCPCGSGKKYKKCCGGR